MAANISLNFSIKSKAEQKPENARFVFL